jgi:hypothetical protein
MALSDIPTLSYHEHTTVGGLVKMSELGSANKRHWVKAVIVFAGIH